MGTTTNSYGPQYSRWGEGRQMAFSVGAGTCVVPCSQTSVLLVRRAPDWSWHLYNFLPCLSPHSLSQAFGRTELPVPSLYKAWRLRPFLASIRTWANSCSKQRIYICPSGCVSLWKHDSWRLGFKRWYRRSGILRMRFLGCFVCF